jgi:sugar phosphate permease
MMYIKRTSFDTCLPALLAEGVLAPDELARLLSHGSLAYGLAKAVAGTAADVFGGTNTLSASLVVSGAVLTVLIGGGRGAGAMTFGWVLARAVSTGPYPALCSLACNWWPCSHGAAVGVLATGSRAGSMLGALLFSALLGLGLRWRPLLRWTGLLVAASGVATRLLLRDRPQPLAAPALPSDEPRWSGPEPTAGSSSVAVAPALLQVPLWRALGYFARLGRVWLGTLALATVCPSFELASLIPLYMADMAFPARSGAIAAALFQLGAMASMVSVGVVYDYTPAPRRPWLFAGLHALCVAGFELLRRARSPAAACAGLVAVMMGGAPTFYIPTCVRLCVPAPAFRTMHDVDRPPPAHE